jgi:hypothetical protein
MEPFSAEDIEGFFTTVTPLLFIGIPPTIQAWSVSDPVEGAWRIRAGNAVTVRTSDEAVAVLRETGLDEATIGRLLHAARFGLLSVYDEG